MPYFKVNNDKVEVLPNDPSELVKQMSLMVDKKISDAQVAAGETLAGLNDEIAALKKGKTVEDNTYFPESNSTGTSAILEKIQWDVAELVSRAVTTATIGPRAIVPVQAVRPVIRPVRRVWWGRIHHLLRRMLLSLLVRPP